VQEQRDIEECGCQLMFWHQNSHSEYQCDCDRVLMGDSFRLSKLIVSFLLFFYKKKKRKEKKSDSVLMFVEQ